MPGVDDEGVLLVTGGAPAGEVVVVWRQAEVETRRHPVLGISEDVEGGYRMDGLPCVNTLSAPFHPLLVTSSYSQHAKCTVILNREPKLQCWE